MDISHIVKRLQEVKAEYTCLLEGGNIGSETTDNKLDRVIQDLSQLVDDGK